MFTADKLNKTTVKTTTDLKQQNYEDVRDYLISYGLELNIAVLVREVERGRGVV